MEMDDLPEFPPEPERHRMRPFLIVLLALLILGALWLPAAGTGGAGDGVGKGTSGSGHNSGSGNAAGTGDSGTGAGDRTSAAATSPSPAPTPSETTAPVPLPAAVPAGTSLGTAATDNKTPEKTTERFGKDSGAAPAAPQQRSGAQSGSGFYGVEVRSGNRILFLVDTSGSMASGTPEGTTRIEVMKRELVRAIESARGNGEWVQPGAYRILAFSGDVTIYPERGSCRFRSESGEKAMRRFVAELQPGGNTAMMRCWKNAMEILEKNTIDTIYFLSDGAPTDCGNDDLLTLLDQLPRKLVVHCFAIGGDSDLLREIARKHKGRYIVQM